MRLTLRQLKHLVENYLSEQEDEAEAEASPEEEPADDGAPPVDEPADDGAPPVDEPAEDGAPPVDDAASDEEPAGDETADDEPTGEETSDDTAADDTTPAEPGDSLPDKTSPFEIIIDDIKHTVQFVKDKAANVLKLKIDGVEVKNPKPQDFVTMAGLGMQGKLSDEDAAALETIVKKTDDQFAKFENFDDLAKIIQDKMNAERQGFSVADIRDIIGKVKK